MSALPKPHTTITTNNWVSKMQERRTGVLDLQKVSYDAQNSPETDQRVDCTEAGLQ